MRWRQTRYTAGRTLVPDTTLFRSIQPGSIEDKEGIFVVIPIRLHMISELSKITIRLPSNLKDQDNMAKIEKLYWELMIRFNYQIPIMDPIKDMEIEDTKLNELIKSKTKLEEDIKKEYIDVINEEQIIKFEKMKLIKEQIKVLKSELSQGKKMALNKSLKLTQRLLRKLSFCDRNNLLIKGEIACEISVCDDVLATEMLFSGMFNNMKPAVIAAVLSCLIYIGHESDAKISLIEELHFGFTQMKQIAESIGKIREEIDPNEISYDYVNTFKADMMELTYNWYNGMSFDQICKMTNKYEGTIIQCFRRLDELIKELINASRLMGNIQIAEKLSEIKKVMKRDIPFAGSLYL